MQQVENEKVSDVADIAPFIEAGIHIGHSRAKRHPKMMPFIYGTRNSIEIIDVIKTKVNLDDACAFLKKVGESGGQILFVGTLPGVRELVIESAKKLNMPYVSTRWIGGTLTNFSIISKRTRDMEELERLKVSGEIEKYPKKERILKEKEAEKLKKFLDGLRLLKKMPAVVVVLNVAHETHAVREAYKLAIPMVGIVDTDANPNPVAYPIPANDDALTSIKFILDRLVGAVSQGMDLQKENQAKASIGAS